MKQKRVSRRNVHGEKRREALTKAAWELFMEKGYTAVSLDEIIRKAGGSKSSVYEFFGGKEGLFFEISNTVTAKILSEITLPDTAGLSTREALKRIGVSLGRNILSEKGLGLYCLSVSVSKKFPQISGLFFESGPMRVQRTFASFLKNETDAGRLRITNPDKASEIFHAILLSNRHIAMSLNYSPAPTTRELKKMVDETVDVFLKVYGV